MMSGCLLSNLGHQMYDVAADSSAWSQQRDTWAAQMWQNRGSTRGQSTAGYCTVGYCTVSFCTTSQCTTGYCTVKFAL